MTAQQKSARMKLNILIDLEETKIRLRLQAKQDADYKLQLLTNFRPNASLRQIDNQRKLNRNKNLIILSGD